MFRVTAKLPGAGKQEYWLQLQGRSCNLSSSSCTGCLTQDPRTLQPKSLLPHTCFRKKSGSPDNPCFHVTSSHLWPDCRKRQHSDRACVQLQVLLPTYFMSTFCGSSCALSAILHQCEGLSECAVLDLVRFHHFPGSESRLALQRLF